MNKGLIILFTLTITFTARGQETKKIKIKKDDDLEIFKANSTKWIPGVYNGKKVKVKYYQTVSFSFTIDPISRLGQAEIVYE